MNELLAQEVCRRVERYCIDKGYAEASGGQAFVPRDVVTAFGMASYIANEVGCTHYVVVAPRGNIYGYFFTQLRCKVMEVYEPFPPGGVQVVDDLSCIRKKRVFIVTDDVESEISLQQVVTAVLKYKPSELCLYVGEPNGMQQVKEFPKEISEIYYSDQIYNFISHEQLEKDFNDFFRHISPPVAVEECAKEQVHPKPRLDYNVGKTLKPFVCRLKEDCDNRVMADTDNKHRRAMRNAIHMVPDSIADTSSFLYFKMNLFKLGSLSHVSVRPNLAIPLSLMLVLKHSRGIRRVDCMKKSLLISLSHPVDLAEKLIAYCMRRSIKRILTGGIVDQDWPILTRAAGDVFELGIDFWDTDVLFNTDMLNDIVASTDVPFGLIVINDSIGQLEKDYCGEHDPIHRFKVFQSLAKELNIPIIVVNSWLPPRLQSEHVFDHVAQLREEPDKCQFIISTTDQRARGSLSFVLSKTTDILEDALSNFTSTKPANYNS